MVHKPRLYKTRINSWLIITNRMKIILSTRILPLTKLREYKTCSVGSRISKTSKQGLIYLIKDSHKSNTIGILALWDLHLNQIQKDNEYQEILRVNRTNQIEILCNKLLKALITNLKIKLKKIQRYRNNRIVMVHLINKRDLSIVKINKVVDSCLGIWSKSIVL